MIKIPVWTFEDMSVDDVAKFATDKALQPGHFIVIPLSQHDYCRVVYVAAQI